MRDRARRARRHRQGRVIGWAQELQALHQSASAYYFDLPDGEGTAPVGPEEDDRRRAVWALAAHIAIEQALLGQRLDRAFALPRTCAEADGRRLCRRATPSPAPMIDEVLLEGPQRPLHHGDGPMQRA